MSERDPKTNESIVDQSFNQRSDSSTIEKPYKTLPPTLPTFSHSKPPLNKQSKHEIDFLYKRIGEY